jgi:hypothetical protein
MALQANTVHCRLDGAVEQLDDQDQQHRRREQRALDAAVPEPQPERQRQAGEQQLLAKRLLLTICADEALCTLSEGARHAPESLQLLALDHVTGSR